MHRATLGGIGFIAIWMVLVAVVEWRSGLAHVPLAIGTVLIARGIVLGSLKKPASD